MFSHKDYFGDPSWPQDYHPEKSSPNNRPQPSDMIVSSRQEIQGDEQEIECKQEICQQQEVNFLLNEQRMAYSSFKHSEVTYLDDFGKGLLFGKEEQEESLQLHQTQSKVVVQDEPQWRYGQRFCKCEHDQLFSHSCCEDQSQDEEENFVPLFDQYFLHRQDMCLRKKPHNLLNRKQVKKQNQHKKFKQKSTRVKIKSQVKEQNQLIEQLLNEDCLMNDEQKMNIMSKVDNSIINKLTESPQKSQQIESESNTSQFLKKRKSKSLSTRYKILSQSEKEYLVYLSTKSTTCEIARKFNVSVNNICRWKKGCGRKVGAGRKITNQELEDKVIEYVKRLVRSGVGLTRKQVQFKAKELSEDKSFKASKGWFQRFYNRNMHIFRRPLQENDFLS